MKHSESIPQKANDGSPLPRFLRGLFRGRGAAPVLADASSANDALAKAAAEVAPLPRVQPVDGRRPKVLVVDDDAVVLKTLAIKLSQAGCDVVTGQDGSQAVATARQERPDVILLDVNFPPDVSLAWDGIGVMQWLQRLECANTPPVIIITGASDAQVRERALDAGAAAFFKKPIDSSAVVEVINKALLARLKPAP